MKRYQILKKLLVTTTVVVIVGYGLIYTTPGLRSIIFVSKILIPGELKVAKINGSFAGPLRLQDVTYRNQLFKVTFKSLQMNWSPIQLLHQQIAIDSLNVDTLVINQLHSSAKSLKKTRNNKINWDSLSFLQHFKIKQFLLKNLSVLDQNQLVAKLEEGKLRKIDNNNYELNLLSANGNVNGKLNLVLQPFPKWTAQLAANHLNPGFYTKNWNADLNAILESAGEWRGVKPNFNFTIKELLGTVENYQAKGSATLLYQGGNISILPSQFNLGEAFLKLSGKVAQDIDLNWQLKIPNLNIFLKTAKGSIQSLGNISGNLAAPKINAQFNAEQVQWADLRLGSLRGQMDTVMRTMKTHLNVSLDRFQYDEYRIPQIHLQSTSVLSKKQLITDVKLSLAANNQIYGKVILPSFKMWDVNQPIKGELKFDLQKLKQAVDSTYFHPLQGAITGQASLSGALNNLQYQAAATLVDGSAFLPNLKLPVKDIQLQATYDLKQLLKFAGTFSSGKGTGTINGQIDTADPLIPIKIDLSGDNLLVANSSEYKINISPKISLLYQRPYSELNLQGEVNIPYAKITPKDFSSVTTLPSEVVFVNKSPETSANIPVNVIMNVKLNLGNDISLVYQNIKTQLHGSVSISEQSGHLPTAVGELLTEKGTYQAYGKQLKITTGRLIYTGNTLSNPGLDIRAVKNVKKLVFANGQNQFDNKLGSVYTGSTENLIVGVWAKGTLDHPQVSFFSDPSGVSQGDILSYLVFGYPRSEIKSRSSLTLLNTIAAGLNKGNNLGIGNVADRVQKLFGLNELSVGSSEFYDDSGDLKNPTKSATTVTIGKKIGKKLSINYSMGLFDQVSRLSLRYQINKRLSIQSEKSTTDNGADIVYEFERD